MDIERKTEKEEKASKLARLHNFAKDALEGSMERHAKKPQGSVGSGSNGGRTGRRLFLQRRLASSGGKRCSLANHHATAK